MKKTIAHTKTIFISTYAQMYGEQASAFGLVHKLIVCKLRGKKRRSLEIFIEMYHGKGAWAYLEHINLFFKMADLLSNVFSVLMLTKTSKRS